MTDSSARQRHLPVSGSVQLDLGQAISHSTNTPSFGSEALALGATSYNLCGAETAFVLFLISIRDEFCWARGCCRLVIPEQLTGVSLRHVA